MSEDTATSVSAAAPEEASPNKPLSTTVQLLQHQCLEMTKLHLGVCETLDGAIGKIEGEIQAVTNAGEVTLTKAVRLASNMEQMYRCLNQLNTELLELQAPPTNSEQESEKLQNASANDTSDSSSMSSLETTSVLATQILSFNEKLNQIESSVNRNAIYSKTVQTMKEKVQLMENLQIESGNKVLTMSTSLKNFEEYVKRLEMDQALFEDRLVSLTTTTNKLTYLRDQLNKLHGSATNKSALSQSVESTKDEMSAIKHQVCELQTHISQQDEAASILKALRSVDDDDLAVRPSFVALAKPTANNVKPQTRLLFENVISNVWDSYDDTVSTFRAPAKGTYLFSLSVNSNEPGLLTLAIMHNGNPISRCCGTTQDVQTSTTVIIPLELMDAVWVEATEQTSAKGVELGGGFSSFTGSRLF